MTASQRPEHVDRRPPDPPDAYRPMIVVGIAAAVALVVMVIGFALIN